MRQTRDTRKQWTKLMLDYIKFHKGPLTEQMIAFLMIDLIDRLEERYSTPKIIEPYLLFRSKVLVYNGQNL